MKRGHEETVSNNNGTKGSPLVVNFACFVTCVWFESLGLASPGDSILNLSIPGGEIRCVALAVGRNQTMEIYMECDGLPLTRLLRALEDVGMCCVAIFTFGSNPMTNGAPEALARIDYRINQPDYKGLSRGVPLVLKSMDFDIRDKFSNWTRFTVDQVGLMLTADASRPSEVVDWCVVVCSGDTTHLERRLKGLKLKSSVSRQYYIKGVECMRTPTSARIYMEVEPIAKTVLLRCLVEALGISTEVVTFAPNQQAVALGWVFELGGILIEHGDLSEVPLVREAPSSSFSATRFTQQDLAIWDCVVLEPPYSHWAVRERDLELSKLRMDMTAMGVERSMIQDGASHYKTQCDRLMGALEQLKSESARLRRELDARSASDGGDGLISWSEWEMMRGALIERDVCISHLKGQLSESYDMLRKLKNGEVIADDQGSLICIGGDEALLILGHKVKALEAKLEAQFEGGVVFDSGRNKNVETGGRTWTVVQWQARELEVYRAAFGSIVTRDCFNELDFRVNGDAEA